MNRINTNQISKHYSGNPLFEDVSLTVNSGDKIGLIGPNGSGKSALIKLLQGEEEPSTGNINTTPGIRIGYIPQMLALHTQGTVEDVLLADFLAAEQQMARLQEEMGTTENLEPLLREYTRVQEEFEAMGGWEARDRGVSLMRRLGMDHDLDGEASRLSGGEQSLLFFARALLFQPELLILDEPGNHLDFLGLAWMEQFLQGYPGAVLVISHNRYLLDKVAREIWHLEKGQLHQWKGNYSSYRIQLTKKKLKQQIQLDKVDKEIHRTATEVKELQNRASSMYNPPVGILKLLDTAKTKLARLKRERETLNLELENSIQVAITGEKHHSDLALQVKDYSFSYPEKSLFQNISFDVYTNEKTALIGANGSGKTTLINAVLNQGHWENRKLRLGPSTKVGYLGQQVTFTHEEETVIEEVLSWGPLSRSQAFALIAPFKFEYEDLEKPISVLSGGERQRLQLAKLGYQQTNFLILDEPTNHLDINSREILEDCLSEYKGTLFIVSHDRYFLDRLAEKVYFINDRQIETFEGGFSDFFRSRYDRLPRISQKIQGRRRREPKAASSTESTVFLENKIEALEKEKRKLEKEISHFEQQGKEQKALLLVEKVNKIQKNLEAAFDRWERLMD